MQEENILSKNHHMKMMVTGFTVTTSLQLMYLLRYIYTNPQVYGLVFLTALILIQCYVLFQFPRHNNRMLLIFLWCAASFFYCSFLIAVSGGFNAPGYYWIYSFPVFVGLLTNSRYAFVSLIPIFTTIACFYFFEDSFPLPEKFKDPQILLNRKMTNSVLFCVTLAALMGFFYRALQNTNDELTNKTKQLNTILRVMCHDLKNDIFVAEYHAERMNLDTEQDKDSDRRIDKVNRAISNIKNMMEKVREWSLFDSEPTDIAKIPACEIRPIIQNAIQSFELSLEQKNIKLIQDLKISGVKIKIDATVFKFQIFNNLLSNAIKFTPEGGEIVIKSRFTDEYLEIHIKDSGIGIPESVKDNVFTFRKRGSRDGTAGEKGTGFGLPLVKEFVSVYEGSIRVYSPPINFNKGSEEFPGTEFVLKFPLANA